jgi:biofilm PGA synthesis N-glycosyltransferase PgaC
MNILLNIFYVLSLIIISVGALALVYYPLAVIAELRPRRTPIFDDPSPLVSIIVPAYNEEKVVGHCVESILKSEYKNFEIILVNDGSKDETLAAMMKFKEHPQVKVLDKPNGGKASALNLGYSQSKGEILFFVDADGIFTPNTIRELLYGFHDEKIGAVCGNDAPVNLDRPLTQLMALQTHAGTGFIRRALAEINCLPIVSGNIGAFRRSALEQTFNDNGQPITQDLSQVWEERQNGPFLKGFIGEDLELTWRIHRAGYRVAFAPHAIVLAEVPSTINGLWKQRVRWARGLLQTVRLHGDMFFNLKYGPLALYLPINFFNMVIVPFLHLLILFLIILLAFAGFNLVGTNILGFILWLGLLGVFLAVIFSIMLDRAWKDLKYIYVIPLWLPYSLMMDVVMIWAIVLEILGAEAQWNKIDRTGVITRRDMSDYKNKKG